MIYRENCSPWMIYVHFVAPDQSLCFINDIFIHSVRYRLVKAKTSTPLFNFPKNLHRAVRGGGVRPSAPWFIARIAGQNQYNKLLGNVSKRTIGT